MRPVPFEMPFGLCSKCPQGLVRTQSEELMERPPTTDLYKVLLPVLRLHRESDRKTSIMIEHLHSILGRCEDGRGREEQRRCSIFCMKIT